MPALGWRKAPPMRESALESKLIHEMKRLRCRCYKWASPGSRGVPDRIVTTPAGAVLFVELKAPGRKLSPLQEIVVGQLREHQQRVFVIDSLSSLHSFVALIEGSIRPTTRNGGQPFEFD